MPSLLRCTDILVDLLDQGNHLQTINILPNSNYPVQLNKTV